MPGEGFGWFMPDRDEWRRLSKRERSARIEEVNAAIKRYPKWHHVLRALELKPLQEDLSPLLKSLRRVLGIDVMERVGPQEAMARLSLRHTCNP